MSTTSVVCNDRYSKVLIVIPAYNEAVTIGQVIDETHQSLPGAAIVVINDGSLDQTAEIARKKNVFVLSHHTNLGIGATVQTGLRFAEQRGYEIAVQVDGDGQHRPEDLPNIIFPLLQGRADMSIGSRFLGGSDFLSTASRRVGIFFFSLFIYFLKGKWITDPTSGFRAMNRKVFHLFASDYPNDYPEPEVLMTALNHGLRLEEVAVAMKPRGGGVSSISFSRAIYYMFKVTFAIFVEMLRGRRRVAL